jgi:ACS family tartrate transporter-like MFS transporter
VTETVAENKVFAKVAWRIIPFMGVLYLVSFLDRINVGFAALQMNDDVGLTPEMFGWGSGIFFFGYFLFEVPSNVILTKVGARIWIARIMFTWGAISMAMALVQGAYSFYILRFLLGLAEAGFSPGMLIYLTFWFPAAVRTRYMAYYFCAIPLAGVIGAPLSSLILELMEGVLGLTAWQWMFLIEGLPAVLLGFLVLGYLPDGPADTKWLSAEEKDIIARRLSRDEQAMRHSLFEGLLDPRVLALCLAYFGIVIALYGCTFWLPQIVASMGYSILQNGLVVACIYLLAAAAMVFVAISSERRDEYVWHTVATAGISALALIVAGMSSSLILTLLALAVATAAVYANLAPFWILPSGFLAGTAAAGGMALINSVGNLGGAVGPYLMGYLVQDTGNYSAGVSALAVGLALAAVLVIALKRSLADPTPLPADAARSKGTT